MLIMLKIKLISEVLAMILMVVIVVGLIGVVWFFISGIAKQGTFTVVDGWCNTSEMRIIAQYFGADASNADVIVTIRDRVTGTRTSLQGIATNVRILKGDLCTRDTLETTQCNSLVTSASPLSSGLTVGIRVISTFTSNREYDITLSAFGRQSAQYVVRCI